MTASADVLIKGLNEAGLNDREIAERLAAKGVLVTQETINRLKNRVHRTTKFEIGLGLLSLHEEVSRERHSAA